jgi:hypothetical protein
MGLPLDPLRLLYIVQRYTGDVPNGRSRWMKELHLSVLVYHAIERGLFDDYDWAPSLVEFHGVRLYGKVSQEANADLRKLQTGKLIEKLHLSTCLYETIRAYRATERTPEALAPLPPESRAALDRLLSCPGCGALQEVMAYVELGPAGTANGRNATIAFCPRCARVDRKAPGARMTAPAGARTDIDFFDLAAVAYRTRPHLPGGFL